MEQTNAISAIAHDEDHGHTADDAGHATVKGYLISFVLAVILTAIPFKIVMDDGYLHQTVLVTVMALAVVQTIVHLIYFLYLDGSSTQHWNVMVLLFMLLVLVIVVVGSLWVMHNMSINVIAM